MHSGKAILLGLIVAIFFALTSLSNTVNAQPDNDKQGSCEQVLQLTCTKCHNTGRLCGKLGSDEASWKKVIGRMARYDGKMDQGSQDNVRECLVNMQKGDPAVCN